MLIRFSVENFLSFRDEVELSMVPGKSRKHSEHIISNGKRGSTSVLRTAVIYGANASGKSNLIKAIYFARRLIVKGTRPRRIIHLKPFRFDPIYVNRPTKFQFEFKTHGRTYLYGFTLDTQRIHEEWLYEIATSEKLLFERKTDSQHKTQVSTSNIKFESSKDAKFMDFTAMGTRPNQLFLTETIERDMHYFEDVFNWFDRVLTVIFPDTHRSGKLEVDFMTNEDFQQAFQSFLQLFDTGISGIELAEFDLETEANIPSELRSQVMEVFENSDEPMHAFIQSPNRGRYLLIKNENNEIGSFKFLTAHKVRGQEQPELLEIGEESDGTQRLFDIVPALMDLLSGERVYVIDELDRSLHPHLSHKIIELFLSNKPQHLSQLIVTTHESSLLDLNLLRRDEIWFVEKDKEGASTVYSLEEFAPRYDKDIQKGYLLGRFGGIPFIKNVENLGWIK